VNTFNIYIRESQNVLLEYSAPSARSTYLKHRLNFLHKWLYLTMRSGSFNWIWPSNGRLPPQVTSKPQTCKQKRRSNSSIICCQFYLKYILISLFWKNERRLWDHLAVCVSVCGCPTVCVSPLFLRLLRHCEAYEITLLSVSVSRLIFVKTLMRSPCCLCLYVHP
jgi:hypothetical protein